MIRWHFHARYIMDAIEKIDAFLEGNWDRFETSEELQLATYYLLETLGEATTRLPDGFREGHAEVPWEELKELRNALAHHYLGIDNGQVRRAILTVLPALKRAVSRLLESIE